MTQFIGVFDKFHYVCEENSERGSSCYSANDIYNKVSEIFISPYPLGVELGLNVELLDQRKRLVLTQTFSKVFLDSQTRLSCKEIIVDEVKVFQIKEEKNLGGLKSSIQLTRKDRAIEFELISSYNSSSSRYLFIMNQ